MNLYEYFEAVEASPRQYCNLWITEGYVQAYCRYIAQHYINGRIRLCFDLATVIVAENEQGKGHFKTFLEKLENRSAYPIRVENVSNEHLALFLSKRGYVKIEDHYSIIPSFFQEQ